MKSFTIFGKRWFNKSCGNTYFSAVAYVDGKAVARIPYAYGYGSHYLDEITDMLERDGFLPGREHGKNGSKEAIRRYCERLDITYTCEVADVLRKKDL